MSGGFDPLVPREIDRPTMVPLDADVTKGEIADLLDDAKMFAAPSDPADLDRWRAQLASWRAGARQRHGIPRRYDDAKAMWANRCFTVAQVWLWDELFFDMDAQRFTPEKFLADADERFGGLDGVVLWHAYPVIGIDDRNQWDFYDVPGLVEAAAALRDAGVRVFVDYNPWDTGTRRGGADADELADVIRRLGADGIFLDTLKNADPDFVTAMDRARPGIGLEGESKLATQRIADHTLSWAQWFADSGAPGVLRAHLFERRHMQHHIRRWHRDHSGELVSAWLNGVGIMVWEVVFGAWVGWSDRDSATLRRMLPVQRRLHRWLIEGEWTPLAVCEASGLVGSAFALEGSTLLALANTSDVDLEYRPGGAGRWIGLHDANPASTEDDEVIVVPARGIAAVLSIVDGAAVPDELEGLRTVLAGCAHTPDASFPHRRARRLTAPAWNGPSADSGVRVRLQEEAVSLAPGESVITIRYRQRETGMYDGAPYVDEWKPLPPRLHDQRTLERAVDLPGGLRVAAQEVSRAEYAEFLAAIGEPPPGDASPHRPVTGVTFARAREFAAWAGGRLPSEDEWQLAATSAGFRRRSPVVWNWTESEHSDGRSRFVMLKGGSDHRSEESDWYFDGGMQTPEFSAKLLLPGLGVDASSSIGFRVCWEGGFAWERSTD